MDIFLSRFSIMAGFTEGNEVVPCVCAALRERYLVMHLFGGGQPAIPLAQLTQRMLLAEPAVRQLGTAGIRTGALGLCGHRSTSFRA